MRQYLDVLRQVMDFGDLKPNRTGIATKAVSGLMFKHEMADGFPMVTTRRVPFRNAAVELEMHLRGIRSKEWLQKRGCHIWDEWCNPKRVPYGNGVETRRKMRECDDLGRIYGVQWRDWNAGEWRVDQVFQVLDKLREDPFDRRMIVTAWNPGELDQMALPPCFLLWQVNVTGPTANRLNLTWYQRSVDVMVGLPTDIAIHGLLLTLLSMWAGMIPGTLTGFLSDTHVYENHFTQAAEQLRRAPKVLPVLRFSRRQRQNNPLDFQADDVSLEGYDPHGRLFLEVAV
jgi:thymidylate synthase